MIPDLILHALVILLVVDRVISVIRQQLARRRSDEARNLVRAALREAVTNRRVLKVVE
jgi:hypothetical protein